MSRTTANRRGLGPTVWRGIAATLALASWGAVPPVAAADLTAAERRGKEIYVTGSRPGGEEIVAFMGTGRIEVPASALPCASCHGHDGHGRPEGGAVPSDITWPALTKSYGVTHPSGREHPPYDEGLLKRAITLGLDPAGNELDPVMPRYRLSLADAADLVAYLKRIDADRDPGISDGTLRIGTFLPPDAEAAAAVRGALTAYFDQLNRDGGLYSRRLELSWAAPAGDPEQRRHEAARFLDDEEPFALVSPFLAGAEGELAELLSRRGLPAVGAVALRPEVGSPVNRYVFYLFSGLDGQLRALARWAGQQPMESPTVMVFPDTEDGQALAAAAEACCARQLPELHRLPYPAAAFEPGPLLQRARELGASRLLFLGDTPAAAALLRQAADSAWAPQMLALGLLAGGGVLPAPEGFGSRAFLAYPTLPSDFAAEALAEYERLAREATLPRRHLPAQLNALAAAKLLVEGLKRSGRELSREGLVEALEGVYRFETGLTRPLTYGPNRRIGAPGAYVVEVDVAAGGFLPGAAWSLPD